MVFLLNCLLGGGLAVGPILVDQATGQRSTKPVGEIFQINADAVWELSVQVAWKSQSEVLNTIEEHLFYIAQRANGSFTVDTPLGKWGAAGLLQDGGGQYLHPLPFPSCTFMAG
jgi:hypothetical protein